MFCASSQAVPHLHLYLPCPSQFFSGKPNVGMIIGLDDAEERPTLTSSSSSILDAESDSESLDSSELDSSLSSVVCLTGAGEMLVLVPFTSTELDVESDSELLDSSELDSGFMIFLTTCFAVTFDVLPPSESESEPEVESSPDVKVRLDSDGTKFLASSF